MNTTNHEPRPFCADGGCSNPMPVGAQQDAEFCETCAAARAFDEQIEGLRLEAKAAGDEGRVHNCDLALGRLGAGDIDGARSSLALVLGANRRVEIVDEDGPVDTCSLASFLEANLDGLASEDLDALVALDVGGEMRLGGGASPIVTIRRVSAETCEACGENTVETGEDSFGAPFPLHKRCAS